MAPISDRPYRPATKDIFVRRSAALLTTVMACAATLGCKTRTLGGSLGSVNEGSPTVLVHCMSPQGNGGNWAATLGWVATEYEVLADRGDLVSRSKAGDVHIYPACFSGGSSGSAATNVVANLLSNESLFPGSREADLKRRSMGFFTVAEMRVLARAMRFLALSVDLNVAEAVRFFGTVLQEQILAKGQLVFRSDQAQWWASSAAAASGAVQDFGKLVHAARLIDAATINQDIATVFSLKSDQSSALNSVKERIAGFLNEVTKISAGSGSSLFANLTAFAKANGVQRVSDQVIFPSSGDANCTIAKKDCGPGRVRLSLELAKLSMSQGAAQINSKDLTPAQRYAYLFLLDAFQSYYAGAVVDRLAQIDASGQANPRASQLDGASFNNQFRDAGDVLPVPATLSESMKTGFMTLTAAAISRDENPTAKQSDRPFYKRVPDFASDLRFVAFMDRTTASMIRSSPLYAQHLAACKPNAPVADLPTVCRFALAEVGAAVYSMLPSVREPGLMAELYAPGFAVGKAGTEHLGILQLFDPLWPGIELPPAAPAGSKESGQVKLGRNALDNAVITFNSAQGIGAKTYFAVAGGWPDRRLSAWPLMYLMDTLVDETSPYGVRARYQSIFDVAPDVVGSIALFGKPDRVTSPRDLSTSESSSDVFLAQKFDVNAVSSVFSGSVPSGSASFASPVAAKNRALYLRMMAEFYDFFSGQEGKAIDRKVPVTLTETMNNWDLSTVPLPAFLPVGRDGGATRYLVALSHNSVSEGLLALNELTPTNGSGSDPRQLCSLSRFRRDFQPAFQFGPVKLGPKKPASDVYVDRIQCFRRLASDKTIAALNTMLGASANFRAELSWLAERAGVTFNAIDPRINQGRSDAPLIVMDATSGAPAIVSSDTMPEPTAEQQKVLEKPL